MTGAADSADLIAEVEGHLRRVAKLVRRAMLDALPQGRFEGETPWTANRSDGSMDRCVSIRLDPARPCGPRCA